MGISGKDPLSGDLLKGWFNIGLIISVIYFKKILNILPQPDKCLLFSHELNFKRKFVVALDNCGLNNSVKAIGEVGNYVKRDTPNES